LQGEQNCDARLLGQQDLGYWLEAVAMPYLSGSPSTQHDLLQLLSPENFAALFSPGLPR
jgi:hypothetical protein